VLSRLATLQGRLGLIKGGSINQAQLGLLAQAGEHLQRSTALFERMVKLEPRSPEWQHQLAWALGNQLSWALLDGRSEEAVALGRRALALREAAAAGRPDDAHLRYQLVIARIKLGASLCWAGQHAEGRALLDAAYAATAALAQSDASNRAAHRDLAVLDVVRGRSAVLAGDKVQALQRLDAALAALPDGPALAGDFFLTRWRVEALLWRARLRSPAQAALALQDAQAAYTLLQATPADPANAARRWSLALVEGERAKALRQLGRADEAGQAVQASARLWAPGVPGSYRAWQERGG
jgi:tetratricopeptide (TPR) repeat protein